MAAVARLGRLAGFMSVDARDHDTARRCFLLALNIAGGADDWPARLNVLSGMARQALHLGDGRAALQITMLARAGEASASTTTCAMLRVLEARAHGVLGHTSGATAAVQHAEDLYQRRRPDDDPPCLWFYDHAQLLGDTGHALYPLALAGVEVDAMRRLRRAVDLHHPGDNRSRVFSLVKLATLQVRHEPGDASYATAAQAIAECALLLAGSRSAQRECAIRRARGVGCLRRRDGQVDTPGGSADRSGRGGGRRRHTNHRGDNQQDHDSTSAA